jgi:hypothetical protein
MLRSIALIPALVCCSTVAAAQKSCYEGDDCEPCLVFLDDLFCFGRSHAHRDPYEERIETERHDFTQSAKTVGYHVVQIEAGYTYFYRDEHDEIEQSHTTPEMMARIGLSEDIEFRVRWTYAWGFVDEGDNVDGAEDLRWSFKLGMTEQDCWLPESALEIRFTAPTGGSAFSTKRVEFGLDYIYDWQIAEGWTLYGSTGFGSNALGDFGLVPEEPASDRFMLWSQSVAIGTEVSDRVTLYNEWYGLCSDGLEDDYTIVVYNVGADFYVTDNFVLDLRVGMGLTTDSDDLFTGLGGGYRF